MMDFELTEGQKQAMQMIEGLMKAPPPMPAVLTGYAGTGKTTMLKAIHSAYGPPMVLTPTGKAALRVAQATGMQAQTLHRWLYHAKENPKTGEMEFQVRPVGMMDTPANGLVIVDEASMVGRDLWEHLWNACQLLQLRLLLVGDTFQLPPVEGKKGDGIPFAPLVDAQTPYRVHLTEITRQALDNPILRASMIIREQSRIDPALLMMNRVFHKNFDEKCLETYKAGGAIIVHTNATRHRINEQMRVALGMPPELTTGEPLLVLKNNYAIERYNGEVMKFEGWTKYDGMPRVVRDNWNDISKTLTFGLAQVEDQVEPVMLCPEQIRGETVGMSDSVINKNSRFYYGDYYAEDGEKLYKENDAGQRVYAGPSHLHANYGYALTCHKSQGSEWNQVLVMIEKSTKPTTYEGRRWLYTAITRAREKCYFTMEG